VSVRRTETPSRIAKRIPLAIEDGSRQTLDITLPAPREPLTVTVVDEDKRPIELAEVGALSLDPTSPLRSTAFTDGRGKVEIADARGLHLRISAQAPGFSRQVLVLGPDDPRALLELDLARGALVTGRVTALRGRRGVSGALVSVSFQGLRKTATTNADGEYRLTDVPLGPVKLHVVHPDFAETEVTAVIENPGRRDRAFELPPVDLEEPGSIEGEVRDERGEPVRGARVALGSAPSYVPAGALPRGVAVSDESGAFTLQGLPSGPATIEAFSSIAGRGSARVEVQSNRKQSGVRITLKPNGTAQEPFAPGGVAITLGERGSGDALRVVVVAVAENSEAERAGLQPGDVIAAINDVKPSSMADARARLGGALSSDVIVSVSRAGVLTKIAVLREAVRR
jgi:hypothetical protein